MKAKRKINSKNTHVQILTVSEPIIIKVETCNKLKELEKATGIHILKIIGQVLDLSIDRIKPL